MKRPLTVLFALVLALPGRAAAQQEPEGWDPAQLQVSRADLTDLMERYEAVAASSAYSGAYRDEAQRSADRIRERLELGDFRTGDQIILSIEGHAEFGQDTLLVEPGPVVNLSGMEPISLAGVLRSELQDHLAEEIGNYVRNPVVHAYSMIRLQIRGGVNQQGIFPFPSDMLLGDAMMAAGGVAQNAKLEDVELLRGSETLMDADEVAAALANGRSLDQLSLRAGDIVVVPVVGPRSTVWPTLIRYGVIIASGLLLGFRVF